MRYPVHLKINERNDDRELLPGKAGKIIFAVIVVLVILMLALMLMPAGYMLYIGEIFGALSYIGILVLVFGVIGIGLWKKEIHPKQSGYIDLKDDILYHETLGNHYFLGWSYCFPKRFQYREIDTLYVGDCPYEFVSSGRTVIYSKEIWRQMYGKYIVALGQDDILLFAAAYSDGLWNELLDKCKDTIRRVIPEDGEYIRQKAATAEKTLQENGYQEIINQYDNYVN